MTTKVILGSMKNATRLVNIVSKIPYDAELCSGRYVVNAKSMLGVLSIPEFETGELRIHTDNAAECETIISDLNKNGLLYNYETTKKSLYDITVFGEILIDFTYSGVNDDGQALFAQNPGGAPANVAVAAQKLGASTAFIGKAGKDMHGTFLKTVLEKQNVSTKGLLLDENHFTTLAFVNISETGERTFSFARKPGADTQIHKEELDIDILDHTNIFHVGSLSLTDLPARDTTFYAVNRAKNNGSIISYDPNYRASLWQNEQTAIKYMQSLIPYADIMKISDEETLLLTDYKAPEAAAKSLIEQGVKIAVVTLGDEGAYVCTKNGGINVSGFKTTAVDTNGAGDSFFGGFLYKISSSCKPIDKLTIDELADFARFGNAVASLCVEKKGAINAMPELSLVNKRLKNTND